MFGRMMVSALALTGVAYAQQPTAGARTDSAPATPDCSAVQPPPRSTPDALCRIPANVNSSDRVAYDAAFFARFNPQNALDMVSQTPGFALNGGDDRRGFSGAVGNLLIDGERPVAKSQSVQTILQNIPAAQVLRVEVLRGAAVAGDASGQSVLVNVVRTPNAGSGVWGAGFEQTNHTSPQANASWSGRTGAVEYGLGGSYYSNDRSLPGRRYYSDGSGNLTDFVDTPLPQGFREGVLNGNFAAPLWGGRLSTTQQLDIWRFHSGLRLNDFAFQGGPLKSILNQSFTENQWSYEIGANYDRDLGPWALSVVSLLTRRYYRNDEQDRSFDNTATLAEVDNIAQHRNSGETILRASLARDFGARNHLEFGAEGAFNTLDAVVDFTTDTGGGPAIVPVFNGNVTVQERRAEAFVSYTWRPSNRWSIEARAANEFSILDFSGDYTQTVRLSYFKPSLQVSRTIGENNQLRVRVFRDVSQLNFDDFTARPAPTEGLITGGNKDLRPESDWRLELGGDFNLLGGIATTFALTRYWIADATDQVELHAPNPPNPDILFDGPGNIGEGDAWSFTTHTTIPTNLLLPSSHLTFDATLWNTHVIDPITHIQRGISGRPDVQLSGEWRQDLSASHFSWGFNFEKVSEQTVLRHNEVDTSEEGPYITLFAESTVVPGLKFRLQANDVFNPPIRRTRRFFGDPVTGDRNDPLSSIQYRVRHFDPAPWLVFSVSGTF
ncbi:MAG: outer membrane beta-barrel protein [Proteobacteria bacterium]|nr:outer membrane beta-barrel protein [Pseudomonadota bacterium]